MKNIDAVTQFAFEYMRNQNENYSSPAEFLMAVNKIKCQFADLLECSPSELHKAVVDARETN